MRMNFSEIFFLSHNTKIVFYIVWFSDVSKNSNMQISTSWRMEKHLSIKSYWSLIPGIWSTLEAADRALLLGPSTESCTDLHVQQWLSDWDWEPSSPLQVEEEEDSSHPSLYREKAWEIVMSIHAGRFSLRWTWIHQSRSLMIVSNETKILSILQSSFIVFFKLENAAQTFGRFEVTKVL